MTARARGYQPDGRYTDREGMTWPASLAATMAARDKRLARPWPRTRAGIIRRASAAHAAWPQYAGHWDSPAWRLCAITQDIRTKLGQAFRRGDVTIARDDRAPTYATSPAYVTAYSLRNEVDTSVPTSAVLWLTD